ncbi:MAG: dihydroorotate dehydrogenase electron transfer subunit [Actinobacteria bacterium]|nr:dihydroorotate dehydrogenase electron transfer subunit [Actinomycetota bacterium]
MTTTAGDRVHSVRAEVIAAAAAGDYRHLVFLAPEIAAAARPGQFVALAVGGDTSGLLLRRSFSIHRVDPGTGTVEIVVADAGPGTRWITRLVAGEAVEVLGPLGVPFPVPDEPTPCVLLGGGYGSAPMFWLAKVLQDKGCHVDLVLGAATQDRLFGADLADRVPLTVTTDDGSAGITGRVTDPLSDLLRTSGATLAYACGPMPMLRAVTQVCRPLGVSAYVAVEESMACGIGVCMTCVLPVVGADGVTRMSRSCVEGPTFDGARVRWEAIADGRVAVPGDCLGSPASLAALNHAAAQGSSR